MERLFAIRYTKPSIEDDNETIWQKLKNNLDRLGASSENIEYPL